MEKVDFQQIVEAVAPNGVFLRPKKISNITYIRMNFGIDTMQAYKIVQVLEDIGVTYPRRA